MGAVKFKNFGKLLKCAAKQAQPINESLVHSEHKYKSDSNVNQL